MTRDVLLQERLLVLMPTSKDALRTSTALSEARIECVPCADLRTLCDEIKRGAGAALLYEEAIFNDDQDCLGELFRDEPRWSNFPLIVLTQHGRNGQHWPAATQLHVTLVERPVRFATLRSVVEAALRHRRHQYEIRNTLLDLTGRTEALRASEERFRALVKEATTGIAQLSLDGHFLFVNQRLCEILGYNEAELLTIDMECVTHPEDRAAHRLLIRRLLAGGPDFQIEQRCLTKDGSIVWVHNSIAGVRNAEGALQSLVAVTLDVTLWKQSERELRDARQKLLAANSDLEARVRDRTEQLRETIAELEAFSYTVSHDLRSPLRSIQGFADLVRSRYSEKLDEEGRRFLERISNGATRLDSLVQDVLAYSRVAKEEIHLEKINPIEVIRNVIETYPQLQETGVIAIEEPLPGVWAHAAYLTQCVSNLLGNAMKFARPGVPPKVIIRSEDCANQTVRIWFEDNGIGIAQEHFKDIFDIFGRVHSSRQYEGTGIGLAIVRKAVDRMGGSVGLTSELGKGTRFWISLKKVT